jgi:hypothetical protein
LNGLQFNPNSLNQPISVNSINNFSQGCANSTPLAISNQPLPGSTWGLGVGQISLSNGFQINNATFSFSLNVPYTITAGTALKPSLVANLFVKTKDVGPLKQVIGCATSPLPEIIPGQSYSVTCTALSGATQTLTTTGNSSSSNVLSLFAPSGQGFWVVAVANGAVTDSHNCWADQTQSPTPYLPQQQNVSLCTQNGGGFANCSYYGTCTYSMGLAQPMTNCSYQAQ